MPASDEFPRGTTVSADGGLAQVTIPAVPGVAHVITDIQAGAYLFSGGAAVAAQEFACNVVTASFAKTVIIFGIDNTVAAGRLNPNSGTWSGKIAGGIGELVNIQYSAAPSAGDAWIIVNYYDV